MLIDLVGEDSSSVVQSSWVGGGTFLVGEVAKVKTGGGTTME